MPRAFQPVPMTAKVEMVYSQGGKNVENVYHVTRNAIPLGPVDLAVVAGVFANWQTTQLSTVQPTGVKLQKIVLTQLDAATAGGLEYVTGMPIAGMNGSVESPMNVTVAIRLATALRGRSYRGRVYHIGLVPGLVLGSALTAGTAAGFATLYGVLNGQLEGLGYQLSVVSYVTAKARRPAGIATLVTAISCDGMIDTQRRRLPDG